MYMKLKISHNFNSTFKKNYECNSTFMINIVIIFRMLIFCLLILQEKKCPDPTDPADGSRTCSDRYVYIYTPMTCTPDSEVVNK